MERRDFLKKTSLGLAATSISASAYSASSSFVQRNDTPPVQLKLKKSLKFGMVKEDLSILDKFKMLKDVGFDGVELETPNSFPMKEVPPTRKLWEAFLPEHLCGTDTGRHPWELS